MSRLWERALFVQRYALARMACVHAATTSALLWQGIVHDLWRSRAAETPGGEQDTVHALWQLMSAETMQVGGQATAHAFAGRYQQNLFLVTDKLLHMTFAGLY